jgi:hypothetical protein
VNADVDILLIEINWLMRCGDLDVDVTVAGVKAREPGYEPPNCKGRGQLDPQSVLHGPLTETLRLNLDVIECRTQHARQRGPFRRRLDAPAQAGDERHAKPGFQLVHMAADCALGDEQLFGCPGQAAVPHRRLEGTQRVQR